MHRWTLFTSFLSDSLVDIENNNRAGWKWPHPRWLLYYQVDAECTAAGVWQAPQQRTAATGRL
jgi:hypothetical protein